MRSIGEVVKALQPQFPDVTHSSLRFLEREGLIDSVRTEGGHRLYPPSTIDRVIQIKRWQGERLSLENIRGRLADLDRLPNPGALAAEFVEGAVAGDLAAASEVITRADEVGMSLQTLFGDVLTPALHEIGDRWEQGEVSVAREKEVSELSRELIVELSRKHASAEGDGVVVVAACVEGELHELGLRMITGLLRTRAYRVYFLGANVATPFLLDAVVMRSPSVVLLSARQEISRPGLKSALEALVELRKTRPWFSIVVGGEQAEQAPELIEQFGATAIRDRDAAVALDLIDAAALAAADRK
jgi:methanogenic corrinoid protein MtbC1